MTVTETHYQNPSAVEKTELWKLWKTKSRFPIAPTAPWKSRQPREIPKCNILDVTFNGLLPSSPLTHGCSNL